MVEVAALELVDRHSLDEIEAALVAQGVSAPTAERLVLLVPSAFAREFFARDGIEFPDHFLVGESGNHSERAYASEPIHGVARGLARRWMAESRHSLVGRILEWSAEATAIQEARGQGLTPSRLSAIHHGFTA